MTHGSEQQHTTPGVVQRATQDLLAMAIVALPSHEVSELIEEFADGRVKVFGELRRVGDQTHVSPISAQRTEIQVDNGSVSVHKGLNNAPGIYAAAQRFSQIEVKKSTETHSLTVKVDPTTSPTNPIYIFLDEGNQIGLGFGQRIDLTLASELLGERIPRGNDSQLTLGVIEWVKGKLA